MIPTPVSMQYAQKAQQRLPWYREPWPWILMVGPAAVIVAGAFTAWLAVYSYDGLVADDYYKQGLAVNQVLARGREASRRGIEGSMTVSSGESAAFELRLASASSALPQTVHVALTHPTRAGLDQRIRSVLTAQGTYSGQIDALAPGRWHVIVEDGSGQWRIRGALNVPGTEEVRLQPAP